jgi:hypothetical protein
MGASDDYSLASIGLSGYSTMLQSQYGDQTGGQMTRSLNQRLFDGLFDDIEDDRPAEGGGAITSSSPRFQDFRRSESIEDRRKQKFSQNPQDPLSTDTDYLSSFIAKDVGLHEWFYGDPAAEKSDLSRTLGMIELIRVDFDRTR